MGAVFAALWLLGLLAAAPLLQTGARCTVSDRLRDALVLGVAIPFVLGFVHALYPLACWLALAACVLFAYLRRTPRAENAAEPAATPYLLVAALSLVAWPQLMRPLLDGDSLSYHLPNAAAWAHAHGVWTTDPRYWWYPPSSELFASALFTVAGPFALGWSGLGALTLLGLRIYEWMRSDDAAPAWLADALAAATVTIAPLALQAGTLQNDAWLAAFFLELLWTLRHEPAAGARTIAVTVLLKPYGWFFGLIAALASKAPLKVWITGAVAIALWVVHDAMLWHNAVVTATSTSSGNTWQSTIAAHGTHGLALLAHVLVLASPLGFVALLAAAAGPLLAGNRQRALGWAAFVALAAFLFMPLAYADWRPQLETGASLRYAAPAIALGALLLGRTAARAARLSAILLTISAVFGAAFVMAIYWNDGGTRSALAVAALAVGNLFIAKIRRRQWPVAAGFAIAVVAAVFLSARHPIDYYTDALRVAGKPSGVYAWIARTQPPAIGGLGLRLGVVNVLAPGARAIDLPEVGACAIARRQHVLMVAVAENDRSPEFNTGRMDDARACKPVRFDDGIAVAAGSQ